MGAKEASIIAAIISAAAIITAALITSGAICLGSKCGSDKTPSAENPPRNTDKGKVGEKPKPNPENPNINVTPKNLTCTSDGVCERQVRIRSTGTSTLKIYKFEFEDGGADNFKLDKNCVGKQLEPGEMCAFTVYFVPPSSGTATEATLTIRQNLPVHPSYVYLYGEGTTPPPSPVTTPPSDGPTDQPTTDGATP